MSKKYTKEEFVTKARAVHGDKYNYDKAEYVNANEKVIITCPIHGDFPITPHNHVNGKQGCPCCAGNKNLTTEEFISRAKEIHGNKYCYDKTCYTGYHKPLTITCPIHGDFQQKPSVHLDGKGCKECALEKNKQNKLLTKETFIKRATEIHGDKHSYDKVVYKGKNEKVTITCPIHGDFEMSPHNHVNGRQGCHKCSMEEKTKSVEDFINESKTVHGDTYDYSRVVYVNNHTPVFIICQKHGTFPQKPTAHLNGNGCPWCKKSKLERKTKLLLEKHNIAFDPQRTFPWLLSNKHYHMFLDFYLPKYNIGIECQGEQHYLTKAQWHFTLEDISEIKCRDLLKFSLCTEHNIPVYYIRHNDNVEEKINEIINKIKRIKAIRQND